jgi:serine/threonine-protein kinase RsbW
MKDIDLTKMKFNTITIKNDLQLAREQVVKPILDSVQQLGYDSQDQFALRLGLEEAMCNAYHHGNKGDPHKTICARWAVDNSCVVIYVKDEGEGFSPRKLPDPRKQENLEKPCGRGVLLMKAYMNDLQYNEQGNEVCMIKLKNGEASENQ